MHQHIGFFKGFASSVAQLRDTERTLLGSIVSSIGASINNGDIIPFVVGGTSEAYYTKDPKSVNETNFTFR